MRDPQIIEEELIAIAAIPEDLLKLERMAAWSIIHPDEVAFAWRYLRDKKGFERWAAEHPQRREWASASETMRDEG